MATMNQELWNDNGQRAEFLPDHDEFESREFLEDSFFANVESWDDFDPRSMMNRPGMGHPLDPHDTKSLSEIHSQPVDSLGLDGEVDVASESDNNGTSDQDSHQRHASLSENQGSHESELFRVLDDGSLPPESDTDSGMLLSRRDSTMSVTASEAVDKDIGQLSSIYADILADGSATAPASIPSHSNYMKSETAGTSNSHKRQASVAAQPLVGSSNFDSPDFTNPSASSLECDRAENYLAMLVKQRSSKSLAESSSLPAATPSRSKTSSGGDHTTKPHPGGRSGGSTGPQGGSAKKQPSSGSGPSEDGSKQTGARKSKDSKDQPPKTNRKRMSKDQSQILEESFQKVPRPTLEEREKLVAATGLPMRTVQIWFQNRRAKTRAQSNSTSSHDVASCFIDADTDAAASALPLDHWAIAGAYSNQHGSRVPQYHPPHGPHSEQQLPGGPAALSMAQPAPVPQAPLGVPAVPHPLRPRPVSVQQPVYAHRSLTSPQIGTTMFRGSPERTDLVPESPLFGDKTPHLGTNPFTSSIETSPLALRSPAMDAFTMPSPIVPSPLPPSGPWGRPTPRRSPSRHRMSPVRHHSIGGVPNSGLLQSPNIGPSYPGYGHAPAAAAGPVQVPNWSRPSYLSRSKSAVVLTDQYVHKDFDYEVKRRKDNSGRSTPASRMSPAATPPVATGGFHSHMGSYDNLSSLPSRNSRNRQRSYTQPTMRYDSTASSGSSSTSSVNMRLQLDDSGDKARLVWVPIHSSNGPSMPSKSMPEEDESQYVDFDSAGRSGRTHQHLAGHQPSSHAGHPAGHNYDISGPTQQPSQQFHYPWQNHAPEKTPTRRPSSAASMSFGHQRSSSGHSFTGSVITPGYAGVGGPISAAFGLTGPNSAPPVATGSQYGGYLSQSLPNAPSPARRASRPTVEVVPEEDTYFGLRNDENRHRNDDSR